MSLVNAIVTPARALVAVDTEAVEVDRVSGRLTRFEMSKLFPLPHANVLLAARGTHMFHMPVLFGLSMVKIPTFDAMAFALKGSLLRDAVSNAHASARSAGAPATFDIGAQEIYLFGWSEMEQCMVGVGYFREPGEAEWDVMDVGRSWAIPWKEHWGPDPELEVVGDLAKAAREQVRRTRAEAPKEVAMGGRLIVAEVTRNATSIQLLEGTF